MCKFRHILSLLAVVFVIAACTDDDVTGGGNVPPVDDHGIGQLVLFSSGNTDNNTSRAAVSRYMEQEGRFVCKMFYHAGATDTDKSDFEVESTPITSWLRVNDNEGNSVYWNREFPDNNHDNLSNDDDLTEADRLDDNYKDYRFDPNAQFFYWRNRLDHVFLAYTDFNLLKSNQYALTSNLNEEGRNIPVARSLFMYPEADGAKKTKTNTIETWPVVGYKTLEFGMVPNPAYSATEKAEKDAAIAQWETDKSQWEAEHPGENYAVPSPTPYDVPETVFGVKKVNPDASAPMYTGGWFEISSSFDFYAIDSEHIKATLTKVKNYIDASTNLTDAEKTALKSDLDRPGDSTPENTAEGTFHYTRWNVYFNPNNSAAFDADGTVNFETEGVTLFCYRGKQKMEDVIATAPANVFDLTRKDGMESMADQPDPLIALTKMKPLGATQEANRVRLYFKHQFSQIQVNLTKAENTGDIKAENIVSVELLGVTEKGYVFTNINPNGTQIPPTYDPVQKNKYTAEQLLENEYGTSFNMFDMGADKPATSLKSFNAIAFGQLQAIRITWKEDDYEEDGVVVPGVLHVATYKITVDEHNNSLKNLQSGKRYKYDFELRRGTIALIRAVIDPWILDEELDYRTDGTINEQ